MTTAGMTKETMERLLTIGRTPSQAEELAALRKQLAEAQRDAERYRWLRDSTDNGWIFEQLSRLEPYEFADAIDQAMREGE